MSKNIQLTVVGDKAQVTRTQHGHCIVHIPDPHCQPFRAGSKRAQAWDVIKTMDGRTVIEVEARLAGFERKINEGGHPLGWLAVALAKKVAVLREA
jgi:hypothetical protein